MSKHSCVAALATGLLLGASYPSGAVDSSAAGADSASAIARYARASAYAQPTLSPDARKLSYIVQEGERQIVMLLEIDSRRQRRTLEVVPRRERVRWCDWSDARHLLCGTIAPVRAPDRIADQTRLYAIDAVSGDVRELNARSSDAVRDQVIDVRGSRAGVVLVQYDPLGRGYPEVAELDVASGELRRVVRPHPPVQRWLSDGRGTVRLGTSYRDGIAALYVRDEEASWRVLLEQSISDPEAVGPLAFGALPHELYVLKQYRGRTAVFLMDLRTASLGEPLLAHEIFDVAGPLWLHPSTRELLAARFVAQREEIRAFTAEQQQQRQWLDRELPGTVNLAIDSSDDAAVQLIRASSDVEAPSLYLFDTRGPALTLLGHEYPELEGTSLAPMRSVTYRARDGQAIPGYLTLPLLPASEQLPAVVLPHGGPESRVWQSFDPLVQLLAAQGYAVLQMNFRGSLGYGARFAAVGAGQWGGVVHNDITDGARWLVERGIADPQRLCIVGMSFGGYAALLGATRESQWYACAASYAGPSDLLALSQYADRLQGADLWHERLGREPRVLWQMSPLARATLVETPILMVHGRLDPVVPITQARRFARTLRKADKSHRLIERGDCDHEMTVESCRIAWFSSLHTFLEESLREEKRRDAQPP